ncbi:MAG TPA: hypothetical protein VEQ85_11450 [Lacipirellulaceae bacterium]|nr:hypothetical protein [Lacipirellulaceae bacterium]
MPRHRELAAQTLAPTLLLVGVAIAILAQLWSALPLAGAVALAGWGTALARPARREWNLLVLAVYAPLVVLAMAAQLESASTASLARQFFAALDAGAAGGLMVLLIRRV